MNIVVIERKKLNEYEKYKEIINQKLKLLKEYNNCLYCFIKKIGRKNPLENFDEGQKRIYQAALRIASSYFHQFFKNKKTIGMLKHRTGRGYEMETDTKIVSAAIALAYLKPSMIITRDSDLFNLTRLVCEDLSYQEAID